MLFCNPWNKRKRSSSSSSFFTQDDGQHGKEEHDMEDDDDYSYYYHHHPTSKSSTKSSSSSMLLQETLRRDFILVKLQQLVDSKTSCDAECILKEMQEAVAELIPIPSFSSPQPQHEENVPLMNLLWDLQAVGAIAMIQAVLNRNDGVGRPSPLAAAPLLYEFARHGMIGFHPYHPSPPSSSNDDEEETKESYPSPPPPSLQKCQ
jgi:hypothetical protein